MSNHCEFRVTRTSFEPRRNSLRGCIRIHRDPMLSQLRAKKLPFRFRRQRLRPPQRHVAIDAFRPDRLAHLPELRAGTHLVTPQTMHGKFVGALLASMNVVTGRARQLPRAEALAPLQRLHLVSVDIHRLVVLGHRDRNIPLQIVARPERLRGRQRSARARMAQRTEIHLPLARQPPWIHNRNLRRSRRRWMRALLPRRVLRSRTVALLAPNPQHQAVLQISVIRRRRRLERGRVALQTSRINRAIERHLPVHVSGTVDPLVRISPVRDRQLEQLIVFPVEIRLPAPPRAHHDVELLRSSAQLLRVCDIDRALVKAVRSRNHREDQIRIRRLEYVLARREISQNRLLRRRARIVIMRRRKVALRLLRVTSGARRIARIRARRRRRVQRLRRFLRHPHRAGKSHHDHRPPARPRPEIQIHHRQKSSRYGTLSPNTLSPIPYSLSPIPYFPVPYPSSTDPPSHSPSCTRAASSAASAPSALHRGSTASSTAPSSAAACRRADNPPTHPAGNRAAREPPASAF